MSTRNRKQSGGGAPPFGYRWQGDALVPHPEEAPVRRRIYELYIEYRNQQVVTRVLNETGYRTRAGAKFTVASVGRWLRDTLAKGQRVADSTVSLRMKKPRELRPSSERPPSNIQPIVSEHLWNQANSILNAKRAATRAEGRFQLFAGFTFCACGRQMSVISKRRTYFCKKCQNRISMVDLDRAFREHLRGLFLRKGEGNRTSGPTDAIIKTKRERLLTRSQEKARVSKDLDRVYQAFIDHGISEQDFRSAYSLLDARLKRLELEIPELLGELDGLRNQGLPWNEVLAEARGFYTGWQTLGQDEKRRSIQSLVKRITIGRDSVRVVVR